MPSKAAINALDAATSITVQIDAILFSNGTLVGADTTRLTEHLQTRNLAAKSLARALLDNHATARDNMLQLLVRSAQESEFDRFQILFAKELLAMSQDSQDRFLAELSKAPDVPDVAPSDARRTPKVN